MIDNIKRIEGGLFLDDRGTISFANALPMEVKRLYVVQNHKSHFVRAWHYHEHESKCFTVISGAALIGVVDVEGGYTRKFFLSEHYPAIIFVPPGLANGTMNLSTRTKILILSNKTLEESKDDDQRFPFDRWDIWHAVNR
jgi:dTDP-4-dehydrorhamnose 3,5-epimerase-like enzyme